MRPPFYDTPWRQARLTQVARRWLGTPFVSHACIPGAGVDCVQLITAIYWETRNNITTTFAYNDADQPLSETHTGTGTLTGLSSVRAYDGYLRLQTAQIKNGANLLQDVTYAYDTAGRLQTVTDASASTYTVGYAYHANSPLVDTLTFKQSTTTRLVTARSYDLANRLTRIASTAYGSGAPSLPVAYQYQYNSANQRTRVDLADGSYWAYQYDVLGQVISGNRYWQDGTPVDGQQFNYTFDDVGNRKSTGGRVSAVSTYTVNRLNQYSQRTVPNQVDVLGVANPTANVTVRVVGGTTYTATRKGEYYHHPLTVGNNVYPTIEAKSLYGATQAQTGKAFIPPATEGFVPDTDGNLTTDGRWTYTWDGENRLIEMKRDTDTPAGARQRMVFEYDHQGRRIRKQYYTYSGGWQEQTDTIFLYDGWNLMGELDANASKARVRTYVWGLDLSGTMDEAGGVGGLLKVTDYVGGTTHHFVAYDGNGNVATLNDAGTGAITARYDYGPFGEPLRATGTMALKNPLRFSTKYTDNQSGFLYYGYRFYNASTGRWLNRDPLGEEGGVNLYEFVRNEPVSRADALGLFPFIPPAGDLRDPWPKPPTGGPGYHDIPDRFEHPADEGKPCCCTPPGKVKRFERTDGPPMRLRLDFKIDLELEGCYKDLAIVWWTCWRPNGSGGWMPGFDNQTSAWLAVAGITIPGIGDISSGPHITQAYIRYLSCENGKWLKHKESRGRTYVWHDGQWTW